MQGGGRAGGREGGKRKQGKMCRVEGMGLGALLGNRVAASKCAKVGGGRREGTIKVRSMGGGDAGQGCRRWEGGRF